MDILEKITERMLLFKENNKEYKRKENEYTKLTYDFFKNLSEEQIIQFDKIVDLIGDMEKDELIIAYKIGVESFNKGGVLNEK